MNLRLSISKIYMPAFLKKRELKKLFNITGEIFGCAAPSTSGLSFEECLAMYAQFTRTAVGQSVHRGDTVQTIQDRLFRSAFLLGEKYKRRFHLKTMNEVLEAGRVLYRILGIDFESTGPGIITIRSCFFSKYYSASTCRIISSLDAGMMAGLSGGATLTFSRRITEGNDCCSARLVTQEDSR